MQWFSGRVCRQNIASIGVTAKILVLFGLAWDYHGGTFCWLNMVCCVPFVVVLWLLNAKGCRSFRRMAALISTLT
jgi:hypothetical protein